MAGRFDGVFHGNDESECIDFICAVRKHVRDKDKTQDNAWIANELYDAFRGKALKWYLRLPTDVRGDWERLQQALLTRWTKDDDDVDANTSVSAITILPTPASASAALPPNPAPSRTSPQDPWTGKVGRVRTSANGNAQVRYICKDCWKDGWLSGAFFGTTVAAKALKVRLIATAPDFYRLELVEHESGLSVLAALSLSPRDWNKTDSWGVIVAVDAPGMGFLEDRRTTYNNCKKNQFWTEKWQVGDNGVLTLCGPGDVAETVQFSLDYAFTIQDGLWFASPRVTFGEGYVLANLEFEPLDS